MKLKVIYIAIIIMLLSGVLLIIYQSNKHAELHKANKIILKQNALSMRYVLEDAYSIDLFKNIDGSYYHVAGITKYNQNKTIYKMFSIIDRYHTKPISKSYDYDICCEMDPMAMKLVTYHYSTKTGELGSGNQWRFVSRALKVRLQKFDAKVQTINIPREHVLTDGTHYNSGVFPMDKIRP